MTPEDARSVLGLAPDATADELRAAFLVAVRAHHPDTTDRPDGAGERTATVIEAYRLLRDLPAGGSPSAPRPPTPPAPAAPAPPETGTIEVIGHEALWVGVDARAVVPALLEAADDLGEVSYVDRSGGLVQITVRPPEGPTCWFTFSTHPRPGGAVVVATLESIEAAPTPPAAPLVLALAEALAHRLAGSPPG